MCLDQELSIQKRAFSVYLSNYFIINETWRKNFSLLLRKREGRACIEKKFSIEIPDSI
jgi:hypothetical protein